MNYGPNRTVEYALDSLGNRTSETETLRGATTTTTTKYSTFNVFNQLVSVTPGYVGAATPPPTAYAWDGNGNLTSETTGTAVTTYAWDMDNRLRGVTQPTAAHSYEYDANGLRTRKVEAGLETRFLLDGPSILSELDSTNTVTRRYLNNPEAIDDVLAFEEGGAAYYPLKDALGSWVAITDGAGAVVRRYDYNVYGARTASGIGPQIAFGHTGREHDAWGGVQSRDRERDPATGRWQQPDRARMVNGPNLYAFVKNDPVRGRDPTGKRISITGGPVTSGPMGAYNGKFYDALASLSTYSMTARSILETVGAAATVFQLQDRALPTGLVDKYGSTGHAHMGSGSCAGTVFVDVTIDFAKAGRLRDSFTSSSTEAIVAVDPSEFMYSDVRITIAHELTHALQYLSATEKSALWLVPDPDLVLLRIGMQPEVSYVGSARPPPVDIVTNQHFALANGFNALPVDQLVFNELFP